MCSDVALIVEVLLYVHRNSRFIRDGSPGRPPRLSQSSRALIALVSYHLIVFSHSEPSSSVCKDCIHTQWGSKDDFIGTVDALRLFAFTDRGRQQSSENTESAKAKWIQNLKQNEAQSARAESRHKGVN